MARTRMNISRRPFRRPVVEVLEDRLPVAEPLGMLVAMSSLAGAAQAAPPCKLRILTWRLERLHCRSRPAPLAALPV
jgi:hypothetical protein